MATTITANGINFPDGSASAPSIGGTDTNTGLFTGSDIVGFATGGTERLRITSAGVLSLNDSTPETWATLQINNQSTHNAAQVLIRGADQAQIILRDDTGGTDQKCTTIRNDQGALIFGQHNDAFSAFSEKLRIKADGFLEHYGSASFTGAGSNYLRIGSTNAGGATLGLDGDSNGDGSGADYCMIQHATDGNLKIIADNPANAADTIFYSNSTTEKLRILSNGDIGVGIATPTTQSGRVLHLHAGAAQQRFHMTNNTTGSGTTDGFEIIVEQSANVRIRNFEAGDLMFDTGGSNLSLIHI